MNQYFTAIEFINSITIAFTNTHSFDEAIKRARARYARCGPGSLNYKLNHQYISFYEYVDGRQISLKKSDSRVYVLARKKYLNLLIIILENYAQQKVQSPDDMAVPNLRKIISKRKELLQKLSDLIHVFEDGNLDIARIVLSQNQYRWYTQPFRQKTARGGNRTFTTRRGIITRSKSEGGIGNHLEKYAVCYHYEEQLQVYVKPLVDELAVQVKNHCKKNGLVVPGQLFSYRNGVCFWNVPEELRWMNSVGSLWKTYNSTSGKITMHNDFTVMLADDSLMKWEHEGMLEDFMYRQNAKERSSLMISTGSVDRKNVIETCESEVNDVERLIDIIKRDVLPRLWF